MDTKNFFFYFYFAYYIRKQKLLTYSGEEDERKWEFRIICVSVKRLHILVTRQAWNALASYLIRKQKLLTYSGKEGERKWEFRIICVNKNSLRILVTSPALLESYKKWVDKCQVYKNSAVYARWKVMRITERRFYEKEDKPENPQ